MNNVKSSAKRLNNHCCSPFCSRPYVWSPLAVLSTRGQVKVERSGQPPFFPRARARHTDSSVPASDLQASKQASKMRLTLAMFAPLLLLLLLLPPGFQSSEESECEAAKDRVKLLEGREKLAVERAKLLAAREKLVQQREASILGREQKLEKRERLFEERDRVFEQREANLSDREHLVKDREELVAFLEGGATESPVTEAAGTDEPEE